MPSRFAFVVPRFGDAIVGGAESHARAIIEQLAARGHSVEVLTTTCTSYKSWRNDLPKGEELFRVHHNSVRIRRFPTIIPRAIPFDELLKYTCTAMLQGEPALARLRHVTRSWSKQHHFVQHQLEQLWIRAQGPWSPALIEHLSNVTADVIIFFGYLYYPTLIGLPLVAKRAVLVPLGDEEPMLYAPIVRAILSQPCAIFSNVEEEAERLSAILDTRADGYNARPPMTVVALGLSPITPSLIGTIPSILKDKTYLLVLGRAGKTKPMGALWRAFVQNQSARTLELDEGRTINSDQLWLVTAGEVSPYLEKLPRVLQLGRVDDSTRYALIQNALAMVSPSESESLSLVLLEAWQMKKPVIVNQACDVTCGHIRRCHGGAIVDFSTPKYAITQILAELQSRSYRHSQGQLGFEYVEQRYPWSIVLEAYEHVAEALRNETNVSIVLQKWAHNNHAWFR